MSWQNKFLSIFLLFISIIVSANFELPPVFKNAKQAAKFLVYIQREIPWILQEGAEYDIDLLEIIIYQNKMIENLQKNPAYMDFITKRGPLKTIDVDIAQPTETATRLLPTKDSNKIKKFIGYGDKLDNKIKKAKKDFSEGNYKGALSYFIRNAYRNRDMGIYLKMSPREQIQELNKLHRRNIESGYEEGLWNWMQGIGFDYSTLGLDVELLINDPKSAYDTIIEKIESMMKAENELFYAGIASLVLAKGTTPEQVINNPELISQINLDGVNSKNLKKLIQARIKQYDLERNESKMKVVDQIMIREVPPYLGLFRGIVGGDCSTSFSGPVSYAPLEHTYFIYDSEGSPKGYAQATEVTFNGQSNYLYLHDVTGCRLSVEMLERTVNAFYVAAKDLGFDGIILPTQDKNFNNQNYEDLRTWLNDAVEGVAAGRLRYPDNEVRATFEQIEITEENYTNMGYDLEGNNPNGHLYDPKDKDFITKRVITKITDTVSKIDIPDKIKPIETVFLYLSLTSGNRSEDARKELKLAFEAATDGQQSDFSKRVKVANRIASEQSFEPDFLDALGNKIVNPGRKSQEKYFDHVTEAFKEIGIKLSKKDISNNEYLFYDGFLKTGLYTKFDNLEMKRTSQYMLALLRRWPTPYHVENFIKKHPDILFYPPIAKYISSLVKPDLNSLQQLNWVLSLTAVDLSRLKIDIKKLNIIIDEVQDDDSAVAVTQILERLNSSGGVCHAFLN